jgi:hypothetical protein
MLLAFSPFSKSTFIVIKTGDLSSALVIKFSYVEKEENAYRGCLFAAMFIHQSG